MNDCQETLSIFIGSSIALINGIKLKIILKSSLITLIRNVNLKFSLSKTRGHSRPKILNKLWVPKPDTHPKQLLDLRLEAFNLIFAFQESRSRAASQQQSRAASQQQSRAASQQRSRAASQELCLFSIESHVPMAIKDRVSTPLKFMSPLDQYNAPIPPVRRRYCNVCIQVKNTFTYKC